MPSVTGESRCPACLPQARASTPDLKDAIDPEALALERFELRLFPRYDIVLTQVLMVSSGRVTSRVKVIGRHERDRAGKSAVP